MIRETLKPSPIGLPAGIPNHGLVVISPLTGIFDFPSLSLASGLVVTVLNTSLAFHDPGDIP